MAHYRKLHLQEQMELENFDHWTGFRAHKNYIQYCVPNGNLPSYSPIEDSTVITRIVDNDHDHYHKNKFTIEPHQESLFYYLVARDGFIKVDSKHSNATYTGNANDDGGYDPIEYSIPKSEERIFRRKENFPLGHIQTKLHKIQLPTINHFTLRKKENSFINALHYEFIVNNEHIMSVHRNETDLFFRIINEQFTTSDGNDYYRK